MVSDDLRRLNGHMKYLPLKAGLESHLQRVLAAGVGHVQRGPLRFAAGVQSGSAHVLQERIEGAVLIHVTQSTTQPAVASVSLCQVASVSGIGRSEART